ncbi:MAG: hypothetical protein A3H27_19010 [Acidobacteria bacterium RIFCSPLOWO2_02_FULL_59_13]|nr:MAG: hypothetical protein A3H27_19010 [Acidobacteria bacterium RIFCSPLOWO2_02_FULL_59_13]
MEWVPNETVESAAFIEKLAPRFPKYYPQFLSIIDKVFRRPMNSKALPDICVFALGYMTVEDFMELLLLCCYGYGLGGLKILRAMYEHHVTTAYLAKNPDEVERFVNYEHITTDKLFRRAEELQDAKQLMGSMVSAEFREEKRKQAEAVKKDYIIERCKECHATGLQPSWSPLATDAMALKVSKDLYGLYGPNFLVPTWHLHSSFSAIASRQDPDVPGLTFSRPQDEYIQQALSSAHGLLPDVLALQSGYFKLQLDEEIEVVKRSFSEVWNHV